VGELVVYESMKRGEGKGGMNTLDACYYQHIHVDET
jgi:hypothetical protein